MLGGEPLHREGDDLLGVALGLLAGLLADVAGERARLGAGLVLDPLEQLPPGVLGSEPGNPLQASQLLADQLLDLGGAGLLGGLLALQRLEPPAQRLFLLLHLLGPPRRRLLALFGPAVGPVRLVPAPGQLPLTLLPPAKGFHLPLERRGGPGLVRLRGGFPDRVGGRGGGLRDDGGGGALAGAEVEPGGGEGEENSGGEPPEDGEEIGRGHVISARGPGAADGSVGGELRSRGPPPPLRGGKHAGQPLGQSGKPRGLIAVAAPGLEQLVGHREAGEQRRLVRVHRGDGTPDPGEGGVEICRHVTDILGRVLRAHRQLGASQRDPGRMAHGAHAASPVPCSSTKRIRVRSRSICSRTAAIRWWSSRFSLSRRPIRCRACCSSAPLAPPLPLLCPTSCSALRQRARQPASSSSTSASSRSRRSSSGVSGRS